MTQATDSGAVSAEALHKAEAFIDLAIGRQGQVVGDEYPWNLAFITDTLIDFTIRVIVLRRAAAEAVWLRSKSKFAKVFE